jgi:hypothetical protein
MSAPTDTPAEHVDLNAPTASAPSAPPEAVRDEVEVRDELGSLRDPTVGPPQPPADTSRGRRWRGRLLVLLLIAGFVALGFRQVDLHRENARQVALDDVTLTADPVEVYMSWTGVVQQLAVRPGQAVRRGDLLMTVDPGSLVPGGPSFPVQRVVAPTDGVVSDLEVRPGSSVRTGELGVRLYQPSELSFRAVLASDAVPNLEVGDTGELSAGRLGPIRVQLTRIQPLLTGDPDQQQTSTLVFTPVDPGIVTQLVPGLHFRGYVDRDSGPNGSASGRR